MLAHRARAFACMVAMQVYLPKYVMQADMFEDAVAAGEYRIGDIVWCVRSARADRAA